MATSDQQHHPEPPIAGDETSTLLGSLERQRATLQWKCGGLDAAGLTATVGTSSITLGGLLKHLAGVEEIYFSLRLLGRRPAPPWDTADWDGDPDWAWHSATDDTPEQLIALWRDAVARSRAAVTEALEDGGLDQLARYSEWDEAPSLRRIRLPGWAETERSSEETIFGDRQPARPT